MSPTAPVKINSPDYHPETTSFLSGLAALGKKHVFGKERRRRDGNARAPVSERNARRMRASERAAIVCHNDVVLLSWPKRKIDARRPVGDQSRRVADAKAVRAQAPRHVSDGTAVVCSPPPTPRRQIELSLCLSPCPVLPLPVLPSFSLHELACAARREAGLRGDFRSGESVDVESSGK